MNSFKKFMIQCVHVSNMIHKGILINLYILHAFTYLWYMALYII